MPSLASFQDASDGLVLFDSRHNHISVDQAKLKTLRCAQEPCDLTKHVLVERTTPPSL